MHRSSIFPVLVAIGILHGCGSTSSTSLAEGGPADQTRSLARAVERGEAQDIDLLIIALDSDDPGERMLAISGLERLTGETFGYDFADSRAERTAAISRWVEWWRVERRTRTGQGGAGAPSSGLSGDGA